MRAAAPTIICASSPASAGCRSRSCARASTSTRSSGSAISKTCRSRRAARAKRSSARATKPRSSSKHAACKGASTRCLPLGPEHGFLRLPEPARGDLFLDLEGDRLALDGGREYLFGVSDTRDGYTPLWATNPAEEKRAFERRRRSHPRRVPRRTARCTSITSAPTSRRRSSACRAVTRRARPSSTRSCAPSCSSTCTRSCGTRCARASRRIR